MTIATEALPALYRRIAHFSQGEMDPELVFHLAFARAGMQAEADAALARAAPHDATARFIAALARDPWTTEPVPEHARLLSPLYAVGGIFSRSSAERRRPFTLADLDLRDAPTDRQAIWMKPALLRDFRDWQRHGLLHLREAPTAGQDAFLTHLAREPLHPDDACEALRYALRFAPGHVDALLDFLLEHPPQRAYEVVRALRSDPRVFTLVERLPTSNDIAACACLLGMPAGDTGVSQSATLAAHQDADAVLALGQDENWQTVQGAEALCYAVLLVGGHLD